jgi:predicted nucleic acid-binding protein
VIELLDASVAIDFLRGHEAARATVDAADELAASETTREDADYLIAAMPFELGSRLLTTNVKHFPMLPGLVAAY